MVYLLRSLWNVLKYKYKRASLVAQKDLTAVICVAIETISGSCDGEELERVCSGAVRKGFLMSSDPT